MGHEIAKSQPTSALPGICFLGEIPASIHCISLLGFASSNLDPSVFAPMVVQHDAAVLLRVGPAADVVQTYSDLSDPCFEQCRV